MKISIEDIIKFNLLVFFINNYEMNSKILSPRQITHKSLDLDVTGNNSIISLFFMHNFNEGIKL